MSLVFLLFLLSFIPTFALSVVDDRIVLRQIKQQLGNPGFLSYWDTNNFDLCDMSAGNFNGGANTYTDCTNDGRVYNLGLNNFDVVTFPDAICNLSELGVLGLSGMTKLYGPLPSCITKLLKLGTLIISDTSLSGPLPDLHNLTNLAYITMPNNHFNGSIPPSLSKLANLVMLDLSFNNLTGTIPPGLVRGGSNTQILRLSNNNLTGKIPKSYGTIDFGTVDLSNNQLSGDASFLFGKQKQAFQIYLSNNHFKFDLSNVEFSDKLYVFDLSHNKIYGRVPDSFATAGWLHEANLSFNRLCGPLPQGGNMGKFDASVFANNKCLCGSPLPPCSNSTHAPAPPPR